MIRRAKATALWVLMALLLNGCWDSKTIQDVNYLTAIGFDLIDGQYAVYVQMLDFSSVAKTEQGKAAQEVPTWVGNSTGETLGVALNKLYRTSQMRIFYGHVNVVVLGKGIIEKNAAKDPRELLARYYEMRYTPWLFGTKGDIKELFTAGSFFNYPPLISLLHQPNETYLQESLIPPMKLVKFAAEFREPSNSVLVPSVVLSKASWQSGGTPKPMFLEDGCFVFQNKVYQGWFRMEELYGLRWFNPETKRSPLIIRSHNGKPMVVLSLESPKVTIQPLINKDKVAFSLNVTLTGIVSEALLPLSEPDLQRKAEEQVQAEIRQTYEKGLKRDTDLLRLEHELYRKNNQVWKRLRSREDFHLTSESLQIHVHVNMKHAQKLKY
ncbi:germination protein, Ger(x)C family [Paenibacillus sp. UNC496MF]|uniref:Ger(x)C family spore germination protein n=1 Tax=Paenibacillus sp. UNC496MF TaxID=1502753 RepID=UPI0008E74E72|nr:Ger(x)C family spore germination protein [Paenibacillus sp. UNC496MF]SFJ76567.1 germination protein, Ger(x)C family [Paenibacillus sp. UNC496MF]